VFNLSLAIRLDVELIGLGLAKTVLPICDSMTIFVKNEVAISVNDIFFIAFGGYVALRFDV
jgi:hypothetical protein